MQTIIYNNLHRVQRSKIAFVKEKFRCEGCSLAHNKKMVINNKKPTLTQKGENSIKKLYFKQMKL